VNVPAAKKIFQDGTDTPVEGSVGVPEPFIPDAQKRFEVFLDDLLELVLGRAGVVARRSGRGSGGHEGSEP